MRTKLVIFFCVCDVAIGIVGADLAMHRLRMPAVLRMLVSCGVVGDGCGDGAGCAA